MQLFLSPCCYRHQYLAESYKLSTNCCHCHYQYLLEKVSVQIFSNFYVSTCLPVVELGSIWLILCFGSLGVLKSMLARSQHNTNLIINTVHQWRPGEILKGAIWKSHSCGVSHGDYFAWRKWGISEQQEWSPKVSFILDGIWRHMGALFCSWKWIKWFRRLSPPPQFVFGRWLTRSFFLRAPARSFPFPSALHWYISIVDVGLHVSWNFVLRIFKILKNRWAVHFPFVMKVNRIGASAGPEP
jgi:hypothetical protein